MRFSVGEKAIYSVSTHYSTAHLVGEIVEIQMVGPFKQGDTLRKDGMRTRAPVDCDYILDVGYKNVSLGAKDWQLRKLDPPSDPIMVTRNEQEEIEA